MVPVSPSKFPPHDEAGGAAVGVSGTSPPETLLNLC